MLRKKRKPDLADVNVYTARKLSDMAQSLEMLAKTCDGHAREEQGLTPEDAAASMQKAAAMVCGDCSRCNLYRDGENEDNYYLYYLLRAFEQKGHVEEADMPRFFLETCGHSQEYMRHLNRNLGRATMNLGWKNRFLESRNTVMIQFREMASILEEFAGQMEKAADVTSEKEAIIRSTFRRHHVMVDNLLMLEFEHAHKEAYLTLHTVDGRCMTAKEAAEILSNIMGGKGFYAPRDTRALITKHSATIRFSETGDYRMLYGIARRTRQGEQVSGDNYTYSGNIPGQVIMSLSDGMGSGIRANAESGQVIELTQQLLEAGFSARASLKMVNTILLMSGAEQHPATLDVACIDLHTGVLEAMKLGASATFILGADGVDILAAGHTPAGVLSPVEPRLLSRKLWDGDRIVMVTDGVLDACPGVDKEQLLCGYIADMPVKSPQDMAERILRFVCQQSGEVRDDMTVLTAGIWKRSW